jgi:hypothetical protein
MTNYDEADELRQYMLRNWGEFMTPLERQAQWLAVLREKANYPDASTLVQKELRATYDREVTDEARKLIGENLNDVRRFQDQVANRIHAELATGALKPNRCPACDRIVKTPKARQCLWCGHDWHSG